ncbi:hypothetical protein [Nafulsella turpanensis]|nr:hypothetical protein [Nafulsella turpanensis]
MAKRDEAIRLAQVSGNVSETARNLGLHLSILCRWKNEVEQ